MRSVSMQFKTWYFELSPFLSFYPSSSLPDALCDPTDLIWREGTPFEVMTGRRAFVVSLLAEVFLTCKVNAMRSVRSPQHHLIITLSSADRRDTRDKWPDRNWWYRHISINLFWPQPMASWTTGQTQDKMSSPISKIDILI